MATATKMPFPKSKFSLVISSETAIQSRAPSSLCLLSQKTPSAAPSHPTAPTKRASPLDSNNLRNLSPLHPPPRLSLLPRSFPSRHPRPHFRVASSLFATQLSNRASPRQTTAPATAPHTRSPVVQSTALPANVRRQCSRTTREG